LQKTVALTVRFSEAFLCFQYFVPRGTLDRRWFWFLPIVSPQGDKGIERWQIVWKPPIRLTFGTDGMGVWLVV
jgi:hypothetical protein